MATTHFLLRYIYRHLVENIALAEESMSVRQQSIIDLHLKRLIGRKLPYGKVKAEYSDLYWYILAKLVREVQQYTTLSINKNGEVVVAAIREPFGELNSILESSNIAISNDPAHDLESIIEATIAATNSYELLDNEKD